MSTAKILEMGMPCLREHLGVVDAEQFIATVLRERFDYTKWQREHFDSMSLNELNAAAVEYAKAKK
jgi:hypothetical protein